MSNKSIVIITSILVSACVSLAFNAIIYGTPAHGLSYGNGEGSSGDGSGGKVKYAIVIQKETIGADGAFHFILKQEGHTIVTDECDITTKGYRKGVSKGSGVCTITNLIETTYQITEDKVSGGWDNWDEDYYNQNNGCKEVKLTADQPRKNCTVENKFIGKPGSLTISKSVLGKGVDIFTFRVTNVSSGYSKTFQLSNILKSNFYKMTETLDDLIPGTYSVTEVKNSGGWKVTYGDNCKNVLVEGGDSHECVVTDAGK